MVSDRRHPESGRAAAEAPLRLVLEPAVAAALAPRLASLGAGSWLALDAAPPEVAVPLPAAPAPVGFAGEVELGGRRRYLTAGPAPTGQWIAVDGLASVVLADGGGTARLLDVEPTADPDALVELLLGPVLVLSLARRGSWCLHASAAWREGKGGGSCAAFLGESGAGKSTIAAYLAAAPPRGAWRRVADDLLPIEVASDGTAFALPRFPQLKLGTAEGAELPPRLPLGAVYLMGEATGGETVSVARLAPSEAALALVGATVAARLMEPDLLARNVADAARVAASVPVSTLSYPRRREWLPRVAEAVERDLERAAAARAPAP